MKQATILRKEFTPGKMRGFNFDDYSGLKVTANDLSNFGVSMDSALMSDVQRYFSVGMDAAPALQTTATITNPVQFFQYWAPEAVEYITAARKIDDIIGRDIEGSFEDEEIVTRVLERTGSAKPYTDTANIPLSSWNQNYVTRSIVRFEEGLEVGYLENMRASRMRVDTHREKAAAAAESLAIELNNVGFFGYADGTNKTYGFLNDPNLPAYVTVAQGAGSNTTWSSKTFAEITADVITAVSALQNQLKGNFDPIKEPFTMTVSLAVVQHLNKMNSLGTKSVYTWLKETYPNIRIETAVELNTVNGGANVFYLHVDRIKGKNKTFKQSVQDVLRMIGMEKKAKVTLEDYAAATAGVICQYPLGVVRYSGI